jgi:hypothetical protein
VCAEIIDLVPVYMLNGTVYFPAHEAASARQVAREEIRAVQECGEFLGSVLNGFITFVREHRQASVLIAVFGGCAVVIAVDEILKANRGGRHRVQSRPRIKPKFKPRSRRRKKKSASEGSFPAVA